MCDTKLSLTKMQIKSERSMDKKFWLEKWNKKEIGFHYDSPNPVLVGQFSKIVAATDSRVLVPLCGKTADLLWLMHQNLFVFGVEFSEIAIIEFFNENNLKYEKFIEGEFEVYSGENIKIYHGDFFHFFSTTNLKFNYIYDRASLVALPDSLRLKYYREISNLLDENGKYLLLSFEYDQAIMSGPPFSVDRREIQKNIDFKLLWNERTPNIQMSERAKTDFYNCSYLFEK